METLPLRRGGLHEKIPGASWQNWRNDVPGCAANAAYYWCRPEHFTSQLHTEKIGIPADIAASKTRWITV
jgi:hypothetical protein